MKKWMKWTLVAMAGLAWTWWTLAAEAPQVIPFQGRLTNQEGTPYTEGTYNIVFSLYDAPVGGTALWTERHTGVGLVNGMVNVFLGSIVKLDGQDFTQVRYLGITIDADGNANTADPEMVPRQMIVPAFFAKDSESLRGADWSAILASGAMDPIKGYLNGAKIASKSVKAAQIADKNVTTAKLADQSVTSAKIADQSIQTRHLSFEAIDNFSVPVGVIMPFAGSSNMVPQGWLSCDGRAVTTNEYPKLYAAIGNTWGTATDEAGNVTGFLLPNLSNRTLWGADTHIVGEYIEAGLPDHTHRYQQQVSDSGSGYAGSGGPAHTWNLRTMSVAETAAADGTTTLYGKSNTVQPPAAAVYFIIKVDPTY